MSKPLIVIKGNPMTGFVLIGPFTEEDDPGRWAMENLDPSETRHGHDVTDWWVTELVSPEVCKGDKQ